MVSGDEQEYAGPARGTRSVEESNRRFMKEQALSIFGNSLCSAVWAVSKRAINANYKC